MWLFQLEWTTCSISHAPDDGMTEVSLTPQKPFYQRAHPSAPAQQQPSWPPAPSQHPTSKQYHTSLEILAFLMKTIFRGKKRKRRRKKKKVCKTRWNAWTIFNVSFRRHVSYESLGPRLVWQSERCPTSLWERGTELLFLAFYIGVCFKGGGEKIAT